ncbi:MAG TPA: DUF6259 domain-containing protein [Candidatus Hydrogenedentes bacterium]|nr:DUF6259 domain-containing protein [Candidatus Hydrogenedentota bacterium]
MNRRSFLKKTCLAATYTAYSIPAHASQASAPVLENEYCRISFDQKRGGLISIANTILGDECLKAGKNCRRPFRLFTDLTKEFEIGHNEKYQLTFEEPSAITRGILQPDTCSSVKSRKRRRTLRLIYDANGFKIEMRIALESDSGVSNWHLDVTNTGTSVREILVCFPYLDGILLGPDPQNNLATAMDQAGLILPAWERPGGVFGESNQMSMQWHAIWDPATHSALGMLFMDAEARSKRLVLEASTASIALHYFPPVRLKPGASYTAPPMRLMIYHGDWRPAARAYRIWHDKTFPSPTPPAWFRVSDGNTGTHFKKAGPGIAPGYSGQVVLNSFRELPAAHLQAPVDNWEYAFYCRTSMLNEGKAYSPHTDGDNIIREDLGGAEAMREGIAGIHRLGLHTTLYVEGYVVHKESELVKSGNGLQWSIMRKDGTITCPYESQGFYPMCPGSVEWQDHLAAMTARLLRETGADAIRLDSLGFYYLPCYNPAHHHDSPFGYNQWLQQLLAKVHRAVTKVKPDVLLLTEGPADWFAPWVHGALTSRCPRELSPMRLALSAFRPYVYASGALWGSLSGFPGGPSASRDKHSLDWHWVCAQFPVHEALIWGDVSDRIPSSSDPEIVARSFIGEGYWAVVVARPACQDSIWPSGTGISSKHSPYVVSIPGLDYRVNNAAFCDIETLCWKPLAFEQCGNTITCALESNWALVVLHHPKGPRIIDFSPLPPVSPGASIEIQPISLDETSRRRITINAPGLIPSPIPATCPEAITLVIPANALPGNYPITISGEHILGTKRFLVVT